MYGGHDGVCVAFVFNEYDDVAVFSFDVVNVFDVDAGG